jgi:hypothetical protein
MQSQTEMIRHAARRCCNTAHKAVVRRRCDKLTPIRDRFRNLMFL